MPDPNTPPRLSQSIAHTLLTRSPLHAWWEHRELGGRPKKPTEEMEGGSLIHGLVLGSSRVVVLDYPDWRTNKAKAERAAVRDDGGIPILQKKFDAVQPVKDAVIRALCDNGLDPELFEREKRLAWTFGGVDCEGTPDMALVEEESAVLGELKTMENLPSLGDLGRKAAANGWAMQLAAYVSAIETLYPSTAGRITWHWVAVETKHPYAVDIVPASAPMIELGTRQWDAAIVMWRALLERGWMEPWPLRLTGGSLEPPAYELTKAELLLESMIGVEG